VRRVLVALGIVASGLTVAGSASAAPKPNPDKNVEQFVCDGVPTTIVTAGRNGWINGERWVAMEFAVTGTVTPGDGSAPFPVLDEKQWAGGATGAAEEVTCIDLINETDPEDGSTFVGQVVVIIRPA
jgi:hypothetical protein